jgi:hypothetical protein
MESLSGQRLRRHSVYKVHVEITTLAGPYGYSGYYIPKAHTILAWFMSDVEANAYKRGLRDACRLDDNIIFRDIEEERRENGTSKDD